eukprot:4304329-Amphidinium_carterae.1
MVLFASMIINIGRSAWELRYGHNCARGVMRLRRVVLQLTVLTTQQSVGRALSELCVRTKSLARECYRSREKGAAGHRSEGGGRKERRQESRREGRRAADPGVKAAEEGGDAVMTDDVRAIDDAEALK